MLSNDIHHVYLSVKNKDGRESLHPAGRLLTHDGELHHLEDYHGLLQKEIPEGVIDDYTIAKLAHPGSGLKVASRSAIRAGHRHDVLPEADLQPLPAAAAPAPTQPHIMVRPPSVWHYTRAGHDQPHVLEHKDGKFMLDGNHLAHDEVSTILDNVRVKLGKIRYVKGGRVEAVAKMERLFENLRKADEMDPAEAFKHMQAAVDAGHLHADALNALRRHVYTDQMTQGLGNKFAWTEFSGKKKPGVYISMDGNDFKSVNDAHGHSAGDAAIKAYGQAMREAMDEAVGSHQSKLFRNPDEQNLYRNGGDEFVAHVPTHEHAAKFARALRAKLEAIPAINGVHKLSMSLGFGHDYESADLALRHAKEQKYSAPHIEGVERPRVFPRGQTPSLAHSLVPGHEGPVALDVQQLQVHPPELPEPLTPPAPPAPAMPVPSAAATPAAPKTP